MMIRRFNPVGQGAFYSEQFEDITVVYDCGTSSVSHGSTKIVTIIEKEICSVFNHGDMIEAVFISHLHVDHMNGLKYLLEFCNVKKVYLPLLTPSQKVMHLIEATDSGNDNQTGFTRSVIIDPYVLRNINKKSETEIILVKPDDRYENQNESENREQIRGKEIESGESINISKQRDWVHIPFNFENIGRIQQLQDALDERGISINRDGILTCMIEPLPIERICMSTNSSMKIVQGKFDYVWSNKYIQKKIIEAYKSIDGGLNSNSMTVYSGPVKEIGEHNEEVHSSGIRVRKSSKIGCLYLGDYNANGGKEWSQLKDAYFHYWNSIEICQIPHHGSTHNYDERLVSECAASDYVISAGYNNKYRHPHATVINSIIRSKKNVHIVTEQVGSSVCFVYPSI